jgi:tRNA G26 N,N-dimethylase Trm1
LSVNGLRTIQIFKEIEGLSKVYVDEFPEESYKLMKNNFDLDNYKRKVQNDSRGYQSSE